MSMKIGDIFKVSLPLTGAVIIIAATIAYAELLFACNFIAYHNSQKSMLAVNSANSQNTVEKAVILMGAGASQILLLYKTAGWNEERVGFGCVT